MKIPEYSKEIYPIKKPQQKIKVGVLKEGVDSCDENVRNAFKKAVQIIEKNDDVTVSGVSLPEHVAGRMAFGPFIFLGGFNSMINGCGFGTGVSGKKTLMSETFHTIGFTFLDPLETFFSPLEIELS